MNKSIHGLALCLFGAGLAGATSSYAGDTILFDPDGSGGAYSPVAVDAFDIAPGNSLAVDAVPLTLGVTSELYYTAEIRTLSSASAGNISVPIGPDGPYELTVEVVLPERPISVVDFNSSGIPNQVTFETLAGGMFRMYHDSFSAGSTNADDITDNTGQGYTDGTLILEGTILAAPASSTFTISPTDETSVSPLDIFGANDLLSVVTLRGLGSSKVDVDVTFAHPDWFIQPPNVVSVTLDTTLRLPFDAVNPSTSVLGNTPDYGTNNVNGLLSGVPGQVPVEDFHLEADGNMSFKVIVEEEPLACRFTGGGVDTDGNWDHTLEDGSMIHNGAGNLPPGVDRYQFGGQTGANTGMQPQPKGEWTHHQQTGPSGAFTFHTGTASAPAGTEIVEIRCSDPGYCFPARPAPAKQLDFDCVGTFKNIGKGKSEPIWQIASPNVTAEGNGNKTFDGTFHWCQVNIDDLGEPGRKNDGAPDSEICPSNGFGEKGDKLLGNCDCPDFYRITIYDGVDAADVSYLADGSINPASLNTTTVIYEAFGYIDGGNLQLHPPTGFDTK